MDGIVITNMRTAAASAVATKVTFFLINIPLFYKIVNISLDGWMKK